MDERVVQVGSSLTGLKTAEQALAKAQALVARGQYKAAGSLVRDTVDMLMSLDDTINEADQIAG